MGFQKATKKKSKLRLALVGPSGAGKTYSALLIAKALGKKIAVVDTEHGSASKYAGDVADFDVLELTSFDPDHYIHAIETAAREGYDVVVIDSLSHAWAGKGGLLEFVDQAAKRSQSGNSYTAWRDATPKHNRLIDALIQAPLHVIATMRAKTEYVLEQGKGSKLMPRKVGLAPVQRDGMEYEFDVVGDITLDHELLITKTRCSALADAVISRPGEELGRTLLAWLSDGADAPTAPKDETPAKPKIDDEELTAFLAVADDIMSLDELADHFSALSRRRLTRAQVDRAVEVKNTRAAAIAKAPAKKEQANAQTQQ